MKHLLFFALLVCTQHLAVSQKLNYQLPKEFKSGEEISVAVNIPVKDLQGIARFQQEFPRGFEVSEQNSDGGIISFSNGLLQFLWIQLPLKDSLTISYKLRCLPGFGGKTEVPSRFYYLSGTVRQEKIFNPMQLVVSGEATKRFTAIKQDKPAETVTTKPTNASKPTTTAAPTPKVVAKPDVNPKIEKPVKSEPTNSKPAETSKVKETPKEQKSLPKEPAAIPKTTTNAAAPSSPVGKTTNTNAGDKVTFRVQLAASSEKGNLSDLATKFGVAEKDIREESHNGMFKYTTGEFPTLADAKKFMTSNPKMKQGAFVTGYNNGSRIDLEEAIRLSKK